MDKKTKKVIESYQCTGCINGYDISCFKENESGGIGCGKHIAGTMMSGVGSFFLGMPKGFNRIGENAKLKPNIYKDFDSSEWEYDMWNIPVWKHLSNEGHTFVRGISPRINKPFIHIFLENCIERVNCLEITQSDIDGMD